MNMLKLFSEAQKLTPRDIRKKKGFKTRAEGVLHDLNEQGWKKSHEVKYPGGKIHVYHHNIIHGAIHVNHETGHWEEHPR